MTDRERFDRLIGKVLSHEGGLVDDPDDPGGITNMGISLRSYPALGAERIRNLTREQACDIYYCDWWLRLRCGEIQDDRVAQKLLDTAVNVGAVTGIRLLQQALCDVGLKVAVDGVIGPHTLDSVNRAAPGKLLVAMRMRQAERYKRLIANNPALAKFERGWLKRAAS